MKMFKTPTKKWLAGICAVCVSSLLFTSCLKSGKDTINVTPVSYLAVSQASVDAPATSFYLDGNLVNSTPFSYGSTLGYVTAYSGLRTATLKDATGATIATDTATLSANNAYSLFIANTIAHPDYIKLKDTLNIPAAGTATIRFVNVSPDAGAVDLAVTGGPALVANKAYKGFSSFAPVPGDKAYNFEVRQAGTATVLATLANYQLNTGSVYTVWLHGSAADVTTTKLKLEVFNNAK